MMELVVAVVCGAFTWSLMEYLLHRFAGHYRPWLRARLNFFGKEHNRHHALGDYFAPSWKKGLSAAVLFAVLEPLLALVLGWQAAMAYLLGLLGFYLFYEWLHRRLHTHGPSNAWGRWARRHHFFHHFHDATVNHGVTSPLWDVVFGTRCVATTVQVPRRLAMVWLLEGEQVRGELSHTYLIRDARSAAG